MHVEDSFSPGPLTSHPVHPHPTSHAIAQRPAAKRTNSVQRANSRFVEGSMNDRTSAAPPLTFLGPDDSSEIARRFHMDFCVEAPDAGVLSPPKPQHHKSSQSLLSSQQQHQQPHPVLTQPTVTYGEVKRPASSASSHVGKKGFWGGLREKLSFVKDKGAKRPLSLDSKLLSQGGGVGGFGSGGGGGGATPPAAAASINNGTGMPSREEIMASYQQLMKDGFFDAHAIHSTRQPPPPGFKPSTTMYSARPPTDKKSFAERVSQQRPLAPTVEDDIEPLPDSRDGNRKRGFDDGEDMSAAKKLRKSASRISVDLSIPRLRKQRTQEKALSEAMPPPPPPNYMPPPPPQSRGVGNFVRRSFSNSTRASSKLTKHAPSTSFSAVSTSTPMDMDCAPPNPSYVASSRCSIDSNDSRRSFVETARAWTSRARRAAEPLGLRPNLNHGAASSASFVAEQYKAQNGFGYEGENHLQQNTVAQERDLPGRWRGIRFT
ncbi:hypothetical protein CTRI78_v003307 [Colletotrichum trifolii]|uniref:Uncharacterized protein n=1 Tax=Colletotrichum trifolii TaxID=5466 RepID=A0A4R8RJQ5_COLTR|nr:hypothetical protein CTRI78_v003307 [Colletotrichum trifolii]